MYTPIHFFITFNPQLNDYLEPGFTQAHEFYEYFREEIKENGAKAHAYWGNIIGQDRKLTSNFESYQEVIKKNGENHFDTYLYISDYQNLWVAKIDSVKKKTTAKDFKTLSFYKEKRVETWFKIIDFALLESNHEQTVQKLSELYIDNSYMGLKIDELSPFTTGIKYPAFVQDLAGESFFDELGDEVTHLALVENPAITNSGSNKITKLLNLYAFPEEIYKKIPHAAKYEIETAELDMLERRHHNLNKVAFSYIKSLEIILNDLTVQHLKRKGCGEDFYVDTSVMPPKIFLEERGELSVPLSQFKKNFSINQLIYLMQKSKNSNRLDFQKAFSQHKPFVRFIIDELPKILEENQLLSIRGILAHSDTGVLKEADLLAVRNLIMGVGHQGLINMIYQSFYHEKLKGEAHVEGHYGVTKQGVQKKKRHLKLAS